LNRIVGLVLFLGATLFYWFHTGQETFWLDSAEFAAVASSAGIPHPPGTPLYEVLASLVARTLPVGNVALRVHLLNCILGGLCVVLVYLLALKLGGILRVNGARSGQAGTPLKERRAGPKEDHSDRPLAAAEGHAPQAAGVEHGAPLSGRESGRWVGEEVLPVLACAALAAAFCLSPAIWFQSVRVEVYSLNTGITTGMVLLALVAGERADRGLTVRGPILLLSLVGGLGLANHHFLTALTGVCCFVYLSIKSGTRLPLLRTLPVASALGLAGFMTYVYLPLRSLSGWKMWGDPTTLAGFKSVLSAEAFHISVTEMPRAPFLVAWFSILEKWIDLLGLPLFLAGIAGLCLLLVKRREIGSFMLLLVLAGGTSKAIMYLDLENPDDHAYFLVGLTAMAAAAAGLLLPFPGMKRLGRPANWLIPAAVAAAGLASAVLLYTENRPRCDLSHFSGPDYLNRHFHERVPPDALFMPSYYPVYFNHLYFRKVEKRRPDLLFAHQSFYSRFEGGLPYCEDLRHEFPQLTSVLDEYLSTGGFPVRSLRSLAATREVLLENDTMSVTADDPALTQFSLGDSGLPVDARELTFEGPGVLLSPAAGREPQETANQRNFWMAFYRDLEDSGTLHPELAKLLVWFHYRNALLFMNKRVFANALLEVRMARRLQPGEQRILDLELLLEDNL